MNATKRSQFLLDFASRLKEREALPKNIEITSIGSVHVANVFNSLASEIVTESVFVGMDVNPEVAILKGLVEMVERGAYAQGKRSGLSSCDTNRSDGFAAFPSGIVPNHKQLARENAYHEAIERFAWATWWDHPEIEHTSETITLGPTETPTQKLLNELNKVVAIKSIERVCPILEDKDICVVIYFAFLDSVGVISGGACGRVGDNHTVNFRAVCELVRHGLGIAKMQRDALTPQTFYERRLAYFGGTPEGTELVRSRLGRGGRIAITLPELRIDEPVTHSLDDLVSVHRCYFENQPPFVGGALERLCL